MKIIITVCVILAVFILIAAGGIEKNPQWKGKIEKEDGIKVIKNPTEPVYGEIEFELEEDLSIGNEEDENYLFYRFVRLEIDSDGNIFALDSGNGRIQKFDRNGNYLQTIGRKGQGPGELNRPIHINLDEEGNIYVLESRRKLHSFDKTGKFQKTISLTHNMRDFKRGSEGNFLAQTWAMGRRDGKPAMLNQVSILDSECKILKSIVSLPMYTPPPPPKPINIGASYGPEVIFCPLNEELGVYAISSEYKFHVVNSSGIVTFKFTKDESPQSFSKREKDNIIDSFKKSIARSGMDTKFTTDFPKYKPFFHSIQNDDKGRMYIHKYQIIPNEERIVNYDLFSKQGFYLYEVKMSKSPMIIKNGYLYSVERAKDTELLTIKRFKIKNWEQIKTGIN